MDTVQQLEEIWVKVNNLFANLFDNILDNINVFHFFINLKTHKKMY